MGQFTLWTWKCQITTDQPSITPEMLTVLIPWWANKTRSVRSACWELKIKKNPAFLYQIKNLSTERCGTEPGKPQRLVFSSETEVHKAQKH